MAICGSSQPAGTADPVANGFRINGRWPFASGCMHANWMGAICKVIKDGEPVIDAHGKPMTRGFVIPASDWEIEDTWYAAGLKGTGSHHITLREARVPEANIFDLENGAACVPGPLYQAFRHFLPLFHGAFSVGMAAGTIDELVALANTGKQQLYAPAPMRESETFQFELGRISAGARAAQAFHKTQTAGHWDHALAGTLKGERLLIDGMQSAVWIATTCVGVADARVLRLAEAAPSMRLLRCNGACATFTSRPSMLSRSKGSMPVWASWSCNVRPMTPDETARRPEQPRISEQSRTIPCYDSDTSQQIRETGHGDGEAAFRS